MSKLFVSQKVPPSYNRASIFEIIGLVERQANQLAEGFQNAYHNSSDTVPTTTQAVPGDWVKNNQPSPGGWFGWVYTVSDGWKGFGEIEP